jgi:hypothetical protein
MRLDNLRSIVLVPGALVLAAVTVFVARPYLDAHRLSNLAVGGSEVPSVYVTLDPRVPGRCSVTDRQGSTDRRSEDPDARRVWTFLRGGGDAESGNLAHWLVRSKQRGAFLLVPLFEVPSFAYPYFHQFARDHGEAVELPEVKWVRLFVNRIYHGLYLQVWLPSLGADPGGGGLRPELLMVEGARMACADTRLAAPCRVYPELVALGRFPESESPTEAEAWLLGLAPLDERLVVLQPTEPYAAVQVPMPVSLREEYRRVTGDALPVFLDDRFLAWGAGGPAPGSGASPGEPASPGAAGFRFAPPIEAALRSGWEAYRERFLEAARVHCEYHQCADALGPALDARLDLPLRAPALAGLAGS